MEVKRVFIDRRPGEVIRIGLEPHVKPTMTVGQLFSQEVVEVLVARVGQDEIRLMITATDDFQITCAENFQEE